MTRIEEALAKLEEAKRWESQQWAFCDGSSNPTVHAEHNRQLRERAMADRMEAVVLAIAAQLVQQTSASPEPQTVKCRTCNGVGKGFGRDMLKPCPGCGGAGKVRVR